VTPAATPLPRPTAAFVDVPDEDVLAAYVRAPPGPAGRREREAAFAELVGRYERRVYGICYRYFGHHADAQDAAQDAFLSVARRAASFNRDSKLSTWLYRVTVNACNDLARKRARRPQTPVEDVAAVAPPAADHDAVAATETAAEVQRALLRLDELSRALLVLVGIEGLTYAEAAAATDLPVGTVKSRVHRARAELADLLGDVVQPGGP
jgi:RNA polymerase sigma-70 factor (ECF subfamily)